MELKFNLGNVNTQEIQEQLERLLGPPVTPSKEKALERWNELCKYLPERMFMIVVDVKTDKIILNHGWDILGYTKWVPANGEEMISIHHENHIAMMKYQAYTTYSVLVSMPKLIKDKGLVFCTTKAIYDNFHPDRKSWLIHQVSSPFQFDKNGFIVSYLSTYRIISEYDGEPMVTTIHAKPQFRNEEIELTKRLRNLRLNILEGLNFTEKERKIIELMSLEKLTSKQVAETLEISLNTLKNHKKAILRKARVLFPGTNFKVTTDFVAFLKKQRIV